MSRAMALAHRLLDISIAAAILVLTLPLLLIGAASVGVSDGFPLLFVAQRAGLGGMRIKVHKLRTMRVVRKTDSRITSRRDNRIFPVGRLLRVTKVDELPQLLDVLAGRMALVGPRPEDYSLAEEVFMKEPYKELLAVRPGLVSPGTLFYYSHLESEIPDLDTESRYLDWELPIKSALDLVYIRNRNFAYDLRLLFRAVYVIGRRLLGLRIVKPPEYAAAAIIARKEFNLEMPNYE